MLFLKNDGLGLCSGLTIAVLQTPGVHGVGSAAGVLHHRPSVHSEDSFAHL